MPDVGRRLGGLLLALACTTLQAADAAGEAGAEGERIFRSRCLPCHTLKADEGNATGPNLHGVGRHGQASVAGFTYSDALLKERGEPWSEERLDRFLQSPRKFAPGTRMLFSGLPLEEERRAVIRFLEQSGE